MEPKFYEIEMLHWAGMHADNVEKIKEILSHHPNYINSQNKFGDDSVIIAIQTGNTGIANFLLENPNININHRNLDYNGEENENYLMTAIRHNQLKIALHLINNTNISLTEKNSKGESILHLASYAGMGEVIEIVLSKNVGLNLISHLDKEEKNCLFSLIENYTATKDLWSLDMLLEKMPKEIIFHLNKKNQTIIQFIEQKIKENPFVKKDFEPILHILRSYF